MPLHDAAFVGRAWHALQPLALLVVSVRNFPFHYLRACTRHNCFCL